MTDKELKLRDLALSIHDFIGFGNPEADILIVGKECALDSSDITAVSIDKVTNKENCERWIEVLPPNQKELVNWMDVPYGESEWRRSFNPRFAFWGQRFMCNRKSPKHPDKELTGTNRTWYNYQKLICRMFPDKAIQHGDPLNFQDLCFITELSSVSKRMSYEGSRTETQDSIRKRLEEFKEPFYQSFPVVIAACEGYLRSMHIDIKEIFPEAIVCRQLSMNVSDEELDRIAAEVALQLN